MKRLASLTAVALCALALVLPAAAGDGEPIELVGYITDEWCGAKNANAEGADCARGCAEKGADLVMFQNDTMYKLDDKERAMEHIGHKVRVVGTVDADGLVTVSEIAKVDPKKA